MEKHNRRLEHEDRELPPFSQPARCVRSLYAPPVSLPAAMRAPTVRFSVLALGALVAAACGAAETPGQLVPPSGVCPPIAQLAKGAAHFEKGPSEEIEIVFRVDPLPRSDVIYRDDDPYVDWGVLVKKTPIGAGLEMRIRFDPRVGKSMDTVIPTKCHAGSDGLALGLRWTDVEDGAPIEVIPITIMTGA
jgi:hypothetical protein